MMPHLLLITIGPVQGFIAQARRTRDLWFGSHVLSELAKSSAASLADHGAALIFPAFKKGDSELLFCQAPLDGQNQPVASISNKILAEVPPGLDPRQLASVARDALKACWRRFVDGVSQKCQTVIAPGARDAFDEQTETFLEFYATWTPFHGDNDYLEARERLERAITMEKNLRAFSPWRKQRGNVPKSSLDGGRETVLIEDAYQKSKGKQLRLSENEQLDAIGLIKRAGGEPEQFVPISTVALAEWLLKASCVRPAELKALARLCQASQMTAIRRGKLSYIKAFPYDAQIFLPGRLRKLFEEEALEGVTEVENQTRQILKGMSEPYPYLACLVADGDRMGAALNHLKRPEEHRDISRALSRFTQTVREIIETNHHGLLIYAGGDDVLAFLPLPTALDCAKKLHEAFDLAMPANLNPKPTLSVGLGIGHLLETMGYLLELGREAEKLAKGSDLKDETQQRNALAIVLDKRSGGAIRWRAQWGEGRDPAQLLKEAIALQDSDEVSAKKIFEIRRRWQEMPLPEKTGGDGDRKRCQSVLKEEIERILSRTEIGREHPLTAEKAGLAVSSSMNYQALWNGIEEWTRRMLIARVFSVAQPKLREKGCSQ